jgi:hypothetical protein
MPLIMQSGDVSIKLSQDPATERKLRAMPQGTMDAARKSARLGLGGWADG